MSERITPTRTIVASAIATALGSSAVHAQSQNLIEEINVTAEKSPIEDAEAIDADVEAILEEIDDIDADSE